ncbi:tripartite tricarboxylate transporter TctB family protein [Kribbella sp. NPDC051770]|uniref:tripartite tricarboxylate transporter TctB family protein n=1 Tax=Kribbella sp. NPDC051770 TaxID=3155413 RepID=UPI003417B824
MSTVKQGRSELGVALLLLLLGGWAVIDALQLQTLQTRGPVDARTVPIGVGVLLIGTAVLLAVDVLRGGRGEQEAGEDVDLTHGSDWKTLGLLVIAFVANILLIERLGWPVSGAVLFFGTTYALGSRHLVRNAVISVALSVGTWYLFNLGLGIALPVGILKGIL